MIGPEKMFDKYILLLGANQFQRERALIGAEKSTDVRVITVSPMAPFHNNKYPFFTIRSQETDPEQLLKDVINFTNTNNLRLVGVIPLNDFVLNAGLAVAHHFGVSYNDKSTIEICRNKEKTKIALTQANLPAVKSSRFINDKEAMKLAEEIGYPVVIKPLNFGGSGGVKKVTDLKELKVALAETRHHLSLHAKHYDSDYKQMVMEPYIRRDRKFLLR